MGDGAVDVTQKDLAAMLPRGASIWNGWKVAKWFGHFKPNPRIQHDWMDGGRNESGLDCVRELWTQFLDNEGLDRSDCPIEGLVVP